MTTAGVISTVAGDISSAYGGDGGLAIHGSLSNPHDITTDGAGNLYISDGYNYVIRKVGAALVTVSGNPDTICVGTVLSLLDASTGGSGVEQWRSGDCRWIGKCNGRIRGYCNDHLYGNQLLRDKRLLQR